MQYSLTSTERQRELLSNICRHNNNNNNNIKKMKKCTVQNLKHAKLFFTMSRLIINLERSVTRDLQVIIWAYIFLYRSQVVIPFTFTFEVSAVWPLTIYYTRHINRREEVGHWTHLTRLCPLWSAFSTLCIPGSMSMLNSCLNQPSTSASTSALYRDAIWQSQQYA